MFLNSNQLDQSDEDLGLLADSAHDLAIIFTDGKHKIVRWSFGAELILGWSEHEAIGSNQFDLIYTPEDRVAGIPQQEQDMALRDGRVENDRWHLKKDGTHFFAVGVTVPLYDNAGTLRGFGKILRDQTKQKQMAEQLQASETHLFSLFSQAPVGLSEISLDGQFLRVNDELCRILGRTREEMLTATILDVTHSEYIQASLIAVAKIVESGGMISLDKRYLRHDGSTIWANSSLSLLRRDKGEEGDLLTLLAVTIDITKRKYAEEELRRSEQEQRELAQLLEKKSASLAEAQAMAKMGSWELDLATNILTWTEEIHRIFGVDQAAFGATYEDFLELLPPKDRSVVDKAYTESLINQTPYSIEHRILRGDGSYRIVHECCQTFYDNQGRPIRSVGTIQDITERKRLEQQMIRTEKMAALGELVAGVAHEINNPLAAISGHAQLLKKHLDSQVREDAAVIDEMVARAARIVRSLRSYARTSDDKQTVNNLNKVVSAALDIMASKLRHSDVIVQLDLGTDLPPTLMNVGGMEQVIVNLLSNAEHALREQPRDKRVIYITTVVRMDRISFDPQQGHPPGSAHDVCVVTIQDTGAGIPESVLPHIFDPFFTTKDMEEGTGLGLYISHDIITAHGGTIEVESQEGKGTAFTITLPVTAAPDTTD